MDAIKAVFGHVDVYVACSRCRMPTTRTIVRVGIDLAAFDGKLGDYTKLQMIREGWNIEAMTCPDCTRSFADEIANQFS